jgi:hypothetical protein
LRVEEIRALARTGMTNRELTRRVGISRRTVWAIVTRRSWKNLEARSAEVA